MKRVTTIIFALLLLTLTAAAQINEYDDGFTVVDNSFNPNRALDSLKAKHKKVPKRLYVWTIDDKFGDITKQKPDTAQHLFMNSIFTTGVYGEYNTTGNLGAPRLSRIATDRDFSPREPFTYLLDYFYTPHSQIRFTNTLSPITQLYFNSCGNRDNGEDHLKALFATNIGRKAGVGFKFDYLYGRGYYQAQSSSLFDYTMWGSYLGDRYQAHAVFSIDHTKHTENGGIANDEYITHPEAVSQTYDTDEIPVRLSNNWNRNHSFRATLSHRYNVGFMREVPMTEDEKEAKRFALKAQREKEEIEKLQREAEKANTEATKESDSNDNRSQSKSKTEFTGRPDDAKIIGDLPTTDSKSADKLAEELAAAKEKSLADSLITDSISTATADTVWTKEEYVPVTAFIHTLHIGNHDHTYIADASPTNYYLNSYAEDPQSSGGRIDDHTHNFSLRQTFAVGLLEGFNKYVPMGAKLYISHDLDYYRLPENLLVTDHSTTFTENNVSAGLQISRQSGTMIHYDATGELCLLGKAIGDVRLDGSGTLSLPLFRDTIRTTLRAFYHLTYPTFLQRHYFSKHLAWDNDGMNKQMHTHLEALLSYPRSKTTIRFVYDNLQNLVYLAQNYNITSTGTITNYSAAFQQTSKNISLLTLALHQDFALGKLLRWENRITMQLSTAQEIVPVPLLNCWTNLYLQFRIARVLHVHFGAALTFFTPYKAPEYCHYLQQYAVQENEEARTTIGGYPFVDLYLNFKLKQCRFFVMLSHANYGLGSSSGGSSGSYFLVPHYPTNERIFRIGLAWTFFN